MTPTSPLPAVVTLFSDAMGVKLTSKDVTLSPDGTVAVAVLVDVLPQAAAISVKAPTQAAEEIPLSFRNLIRTSYPRILVIPRCLLTGDPGARVRRQRAYSAGRDYPSGTRVCQESDRAEAKTC